MKGLGRARRAAALALAVALAGLPARTAFAHAGSGPAEPVLEHVSPAVPGIDIRVAHSVNYQLLAANTTGQTITFLADTGEPFLRIGPDGVDGNFASPAFYDSNVPEGLTEYPEQARPGSGVTPIWRRISAQPNWGWFDHRLHPAGGGVSPDVLRANEPAVLGTWTIPFRLDEQPGEVRGRFEFRPSRGTYAMVQKSSPAPAPDVTIQVVSASRVPAIFVENHSPDPVVVLGRDGEPFARIGPEIAEVNVRSPLWAEQQQALGKDPGGESDSAAEPEWQQVADRPRWQWLEFRAAAPEGEPPEPVIAAGRPTTVKTWSIPVLIGNRRSPVEGITEFVPLEALRRQASGDPDPGGGSGIPLAAAALVVAVLAGGGWLLTSTLRSRAAAKGEPWTS